MKNNNSVGKQRPVNANKNIQVYMRDCRGAEQQGSHRPAVFGIEDVEKVHIRSGVWTGFKASKLKWSQHRFFLHGAVKLIVL